jgi:endoglycosylceramidase
MNEPHPGSDLDVVELIGGKPNPTGSHARFDREEFTPFYQRTIDAIRAVDADNWVFVEPRYGAPGLGMPSYLDPLTDPRPGAPRLAYAPHLYSLKAEATGTYEPIGDPAVANWERERQVELARQPMPLLLGEWGFAHSTGNARRYLSDVLEMADRNLSSWAWWAYDCGGWGFWECDGAERPMVADVIRAYPRRVAGVPSAFSYDPGSRELVLTYADAPGIGGATEISAPSRLYPEGPRVMLDGGPLADEPSWDRTRGVLSVTVPVTGGVHEIRVGPALSANRD